MRTRSSTSYVVLICLGSALLVLGAVLHLFFGYPWLIESLAPAHLSIEAGLRAVWLAGGLNSLFFAAIALAQLRTRICSRTVVCLVAIAALANATVVGFVRDVQPFHPALLVFVGAGILLLMAAYLQPPRSIR